MSFTPALPLVTILTLRRSLAARDGINAVSKFSQDCPKARLTFCGFSAADKKLIKETADLGVDPARIHLEPRPRTTSEDAVYLAALLKPKSRKRWLLVTTAVHMPRAVGCCRVAEFQVEPYPVEFMTSPVPSFRRFRYWFFSLGPTRPRRKGVDRPHRLSGDG